MPLFSRKPRPLLEESAIKKSKDFSKQSIASPDPTSRTLKDPSQHLLDKHEELLDEYEINSEHASIHATQQKSPAYLPSLADVVKEHTALAGSPEMLSNLEENPDIWEALNNTFRGQWIDYHLGGTQHKTIRGFTQKTAAHHPYNGLHEPWCISVEEYILRTYGLKLRHPEYPCVLIECNKHTPVPLELCRCAVFSAHTFPNVQEHQPVVRKKGGQLAVESMASSMHLLESEFGKVLNRVSAITGETHRLKKITYGKDFITSFEQLLTKMAPDKFAKRMSKQVVRAAMALIMELDPEKYPVDRVHMGGVTGRKMTLYNNFESDLIVFVMNEKVLAARRDFNMSLRLALEETGWEMLDDQLHLSMKHDIGGVINVILTLNLVNVERSDREGYQRDQLLWPVLRDPRRATSDPSRLIGMEESTTAFYRAAGKQVASIVRVFKAWADYVLLVQANEMRRAIRSELTAFSKIKTQKAKSLYAKPRESRTDSQPSMAMPEDVGMIPSAEDGSPPRIASPIQDLESLSNPESPDRLRPDRSWLAGLPDKPVKAAAVVPRLSETGVLPDQPEIGPGDEEMEEEVLSPFERPSPTHGTGPMEMYNGVYVGLMEFNARERKALLLGKLQSVPFTTKSTAQLASLAGETAAEMATRDLRRTSSRSYTSLGEINRLDMKLGVGAEETPPHRVTESGLAPLPQMGTDGSGLAAANSQLRESLPEISFSTIAKTLLPSPFRANPLNILKHTVRGRVQMNARDENLRSSVPQLPSPNSMSPSSLSPHPLSPIAPFNGALLRSPPHTSTDGSEGPDAHNTSTRGDVASFLANVNASVENTTSGTMPRNNLAGVNRTAVGRFAALSNRYAGATGSESLLGNFNGPPLHESISLPANAGQMTAADAEPASPFSSSLSRITEEPGKAGSSFLPSLQGGNRRLTSFGSGICVGAAVGLEPERAKPEEEAKTRGRRTSLTDGTSTIDFVMNPGTKPSAKRPVFPQAFAELLVVHALSLFPEERVPSAVHLFVKVLELAAQKLSPSARNVLVVKNLFYNHITAKRFQHLWEQYPRLVHPVDPSCNLTDYIKFNGWTILAKEAWALLELMRTADWDCVVSKSSLGRVVDDARRRRG